MGLEVASKDDFNQLSNKMDELIKQFKALSTRLPMLKVVTVNDICIMEGISKSTVCMHKYYLPRFGVSAYPGHAKWDMDEYLAWSNRPIEERKAEYQEMTFRKNQRK